MKIKIHSIESIITRAMLPFEPKTILISIGDTGAQPPNLLNKPDYILRLNFDDITLEEAKSELWMPPSVTSLEEKVKEGIEKKIEEEVARHLRSCNIELFNDEQAKLIAEFVFRHIRDTDVLICQCHYGQSRSAGCAAAIMEYFNGNGIDIFADERFYPNRYVYHKMMKALEECEQE